MAKLLIVDPLNMTLLDAEGRVEWSSRSCFERALEGVQGVVCEYFDGVHPELCRMAATADGVILGGSEATAWEDTSFNDHLLDLIAICRHNKIPLLGICFGAQLLGRALGGRVERHPDGIELGAPAIRLSAKGRKHFLFSSMKAKCFWSVEAHHDAVMTLPPGCELLASTEHTPVQAFSFEGLLNGVQFHPEMSADDLRFLWKAFEREGIVDTTTNSYREIIDACECEAVYSVIQNFASNVKSRKTDRVSAI